MEYEIGKWYKFNTKHAKYTIYAKLNKIENNYFYYEDEKYIEVKNGYIMGTCISMDYIESPELLTDLSEIQQYLPEGHPDKLFILPPNWHVLVTEDNLQECINWRFSNIIYSNINFKNWLSTKYLVGMTLNFNKDLEKGHNEYCYVKDIKGSFDFGKEITTEQFRKYVLNQQVIHNKKLTELLIKIGIT